MNPNDERQACLMLWSAILERALLDSTLKGHLRQKALNWFATANPKKPHADHSYHQACQLLSLDPAWLKEPRIRDKTALNLREQRRQPLKALTGE